MTPRKGSNRRAISKFNRIRRVGIANPDFSNRLAIRNAAWPVARVARAFREPVFCTRARGCRKPGRFFNRIKHFRRLATRYEKHAANLLAMLKLAAAHLWLRHESVT